jgi:hypothetical protein
VRRGPEQCGRTMGRLEVADENQVAQTDRPERAARQTPPMARSDLAAEHERVGRLLLVALIALLMTGCGGDPRRLGEGSWYGKVVAVNIAQRTLTFAPACRLSKSGRWIAVPAARHVPAVVRLAEHADLQIYYRPSGNPAEGHGQGAELKEFADVALRGRLPHFPPGWFVTVRDDAAVSVEEDSGVRSSGTADRRKFACVWSRSTRRFVSR